jgi:hypothetical protein
MVAGAYAAGGHGHCLWLQVMGIMTGFILSKWYADCTSEQGNAMILYSAELGWRGPAIHYTSLLTHRRGSPPRSRFSLRKQPAPEAQQSGIEWRSRAWKAEGRWSEPAAGMREVLFHSPAGSLEWNCVAPRASARVRIDGDEMRGWGYVEHLRLSVAPWRLPIQQLRWGRFVNDTDMLVWIDWRGSYNRQVVYYNGAPVSASEIGDRKIVLADGNIVLSLDTGVTLREGLLGATALAVLPNLDRIFPARILKVREQKWLSRGVLQQPGRPDSAGMAIHEVVEWP